MKNNKMRSWFFENISQTSVETALKECKIKIKEQKGKLQTK